MSKTLYKHTHLTATLIFVALAATAGSAIALMKENRSEASAAPTLGRFIVSAHNAKFVPANRDEQTSTLLSNVSQ